MSYTTLTVDIYWGVPLLAILPFRTESYYQPITEKDSKYPHIKAHKTERNIEQSSDKESHPSLSRYSGDVPLFFACITVAL